MFCISSISLPEPYQVRVISVSIRMDLIRTRYGPDTDRIRFRQENCSKSPITNGKSYDIPVESALLSF